MSGPATLGVPAAAAPHKSLGGRGRGGRPARRKGCSLPRGSHRRTLAPGNQEAGTPGLWSQIRRPCPPRVPSPALVLSVVIVCLYHECKTHGERTLGVKSVWHGETPLGLSNSMTIYPTYIGCHPDAVKTKMKIRPQRA